MCLIGRGEEIREKTPLLRRFLAFFYLGWKRYDWSLGASFALIRLVALWLFFASAACFVGTRGVPALYDLWEGIEKPAGGSPSNARQEKPSGSDVDKSPKPTPEKSSELSTKQIVDPFKSVHDFLFRFPIIRRFVSKAGLLASWTGYSLILLLLLERIAKISDPITLEAKKRVLVPDYEKNLAFVEQFHRDFGYVVDAYFGSPIDYFRRISRHRVFVFIDDLDRCEIPRAADLIQGLNLLISDSPKIVFILSAENRRCPCRKV
jgi:hypothetical protein